MYWIINENIAFRPESKSLLSLIKPDLSVILTTPACRCLTLMLEASPGVVTQQALFRHVWENEGMHVPANTLYQNISIIRRGLRHVGETSETLIATVPRKGFQIAQNIPVRRKAKETSATTIVQSPQPELAQSVSCAQNEIVSPAKVHQPQREGKSWPQLMPLLIMLCVLLTGLITVQWFWQRSTTERFFSDYTLLEQVSGCNFNIRDDGLADMHLYQKFKSQILASGIDCKKYPWLYFPVLSSAPALAVLVCQKNYQNHSVPGCITLSFRDSQNEQNK